MININFAVHKIIIPLITEFKNINLSISLLIIKAQYFDKIKNGHSATEKITQDEHYQVKDNLKVEIKRLRFKKGTIKDRYLVNKLKETNICESSK